MNTLVTRFLSLITLLLSVSFAGHATHVSGGDISVEHLGGTQYEITMNLFADCAGNAGAINNLDNNQTVRVQGTCLPGFGFINASMEVQNPGGTEVSQVCPSSLNSTTCNGGTLPGLLRFTYKDTITLTNPNCQIEFRYSIANRNATVNVNNSINQRFYIETVLEYGTSGSSNSSPRFIFDPIAYGVPGQPLNISFGAFDSDGDSLKYSLVNAQSIGGFLGGTPSNMTYNTGYSATSPIQGVILDQFTGALVAQPTTTGNFIIVVKVEEFDATGNLIGEVLRDIQVVIVNSTNLFPVAPATFTNFSGYADSTNQTTVTAYPGMDFCLDLVFTDGNSLDSLTLATNLSTVLPGASLSVSGQNPLTVNVCWTATTGLPTNNTVIFNVSDSACPITGIASYSLNVVVPQCQNAFGVLRTEDVTCANNCDGRAFVKMFCGSGNYSYTWSGGPGFVVSGQGTDTVDVCPSSTPYQLVVNDIGNGTSWSQSFSILNPTQLIVTETITQEDCDPSQCVGSISLSSIGGTGTVTYNWSNGSTGPSIAGLCAGIYTVTAADANGCDTILTYEIIEPVPVTSSVFSTTDVLCAGDSTGEAVVVGSLASCGLSVGGCPGASELDTIGTATTTNAANAFPAIYGGSQSSARHQMLFTAAELTAAGLNAGPINSISFFVETQSFVTVYQNMQIKMGCTSSGNLSSGWESGLITVKNSFDHTTATGWNTHLLDNSYIWDGTSNIVIDVCFSNGGGFTNANTQTRFTTTTFISTRYSTTNNTGNPVCDNNGFAGTPSGFRPNVRFGHCEQPFTYAWSPAPAAGQASDTITGLPAGDYFVTITTADGCSDTDTVSISEPTPLLASITEDAGVTCGNPVAQLTASATGGAPGYSFAWSTGGNTATISGLPAGTYTVTVTDTNSCTDTAVYTITAPAPVVASINVDNGIVCNGDNTGGLTVTASGGTPGYTYSWNTGSTSTTINGLVAGTYTVTVTDIATCTATAQVTLADPPNLLVATGVISQISCNGICDGSAEALIIGGVAPYSVSWSNGETADTAVALCDGTTTVSVTDANGCLVTGTVTLTQPAALVASNTIDQQNDCNGDCDAKATVSATGGTAPYSFAWPSGATTAQDTSLCAGTYIVTVTDANLCSVLDTVVITEPVALLAGITVDQQISCNGANDGELTATGSGGTPGYSFNWSTGATSASITSLAPGTYTVSVTDNSGCTDTSQVTLIDPSALVASINVDTAINCNGDNSGVLTASALGGTPGYGFSWSTGALTPTINGLFSGTYTVTVTDTAGCTTTAQTTLTDPASLLVNTAILNTISCNGVCDGSAEVLITGGVSPYTIAWSNGETADTAVALCDGTTTVSVTDANGCLVTSTVTLTQPAALVASNTIDQQNACNGDCDAKATVSATGGTAPYSFAWPSGATTAQDTSLCAGTYIVTVTDSNLCSVLDTVVITEPLAILTSVTITDSISCNGICDGVAVASAVGGTAPYSFLWSTGSVIDTASSLCASTTYFVTITEGAGCSVVDSVEFTEPTALTVISTITQQVSCSSIGCDGEATAAVIGGTAPYSYLWSNGDTGVFADSVCAGQLTLVVTDANGCQVFDTLNLIPNSGFTATISGTTDESCFGASDGSATVSVNIPGTDYIYAWSPAPAAGQTTPTASGLSQGTYIVTVTDTNTSCVDTALATIGGPTQIVITTSVTQAVSCNGVCDGAITATATGGAAGYTFVWNGTLNGASQTGLCADTHIVQVTDGAGCVVIDTLILTEPSALTVAKSIVDASCSGGCTGEINLGITGGTPVYTVAWSNGSTGDTLTGLCQGTYIATITDANGCTITDTSIVNQPGNILTSITLNNGVSCSGVCDASVTATASNGVAPYTFTWSNGSTGATQFGLCAGSYVVTIADAAGCSVQDTIVINNPSPIVVNSSISQAILCGGSCTGEITVAASGGTAPFNISWSNGSTGSVQSGLCAGTYNITITDANGCSEIDTVQLTEPTPLVTSFTVGTASCGLCDGSISLTTTGGTAPYSYNWTTIIPSPGNVATVSNLCVGVYNVIVTDAGGCSDTLDIPVSSVGGITNANFATVNPSCSGVCDGGSTVANVGGVPPFSYAWSTGNPNDTLAGVTNLCGGIYYVTITDASGCAFIASDTLTEPVGPTNSIDTTFASCNGSCDATAIITNTLGSAPFTFAWSDGGTGTSRTGLCAGVYFVTTSDANGCTAIDTIAIGEPAPLVGSVGTTGASCFNTCDGTGTASAINGTAPYSFSWSSGESGPNAVALCVGVNTVTITDANGCFIVDTATVVGPSAILVNNVQVQDASCGLQDGSVTLAVSGGTGPYTYAWSNGTSANPLVNVGLGTYTVTITDAIGCSIVQSFNVSEVGGPSISTTATNESCSGACDGTATVTLPAGGPYSIQWSTNPNDTNATVSGLCAGNYVVTVTGTPTGCSTIDTVSVNSPTPIVISNVALTSPSCGGSNGAIDVTITGGTAPYSYNWNGLIGPNPNTGLSAGSYVLVVTDAAGCTVSDTIALQDVGNINVTFLVTNLTCGNICDGQAIALVPGPVTNYAFAWSTGVSSDTLSNVCTGSYTVTVTETSTGCQAIDTVQISGPAPILFSNVTVTDANCGVADGSISVSVTGGQPSYSYAWSNGQTGSTATNLLAGGYSVTVTDASGCSEQIAVPLGNTGAPSISTTATDADCDGSCTGTATVALPAGGPYSIVWSTGNPNDTNATVSGLCPGTYFVTVNDGSGCIAVDTAVVNQPPGLSLNLLTVDNTPCGTNCTGAITAIASGGARPYTYVWSVPSAGDSLINGLCGGTYTVTITSADGCSEVATVTLNDNPAFEVTVNQVVDATCTGISNGSIAVTTNGGATPYSFLWSGNGFTANTEDINNLLPGTYILQATDATGCVLTRTVQVGVVDTLLVSVSDTVLCANEDSLTLSAQVTGTAPFTFQWFDENGIPLGTEASQTLPVVPNDTLNYAVQVNSAAGCVASDTATVSTVRTPLVDAGPDTSIVIGESVTIGGSPTSDFGGSTYLWTPGNTLDDSTSANPEASPEVTTVYTVLVTNLLGCTNTQAMTVNVSTGFDYPSGFSPNGDGANDTWQLDFLSKYPDCRVDIYNRWGQLVFSSDGYAEAWDGTFEGEDLPVGTYYYVIDLGREDISDPITGPITIMR